MKAWLSIIVSLFLLAGAGCRGSRFPADPFRGLATMETQWAASLEKGGRVTPLTLVLVTASTRPDQGRLVILSSFGATWGDCWLAEGKASCRTNPRSAALARLVADPMATTLARLPGWLNQAENRELKTVKGREIWVLRLQKLK